MTVVVNRTALVFGLALVLGILPACQPFGNDAAGTPAQQASAGSTGASQTAASRPAPVPQSPPDFASIVQANGGAVVNIRASSAPKAGADHPLPGGDPFFEFFRRFQIPEPELPRSGMGSGFIVRSDGVVLTNAHVVAGADTVLVKLSDRREFKAQIVGADEQTDIAVLRIDAKNLPTVRLGDARSVRVGDWVLAIGNPYGFGGTVTAGIISALHRVTGVTPSPAYDRYIQTDAAINMGNSGGPMFDLQGNVIGINTALISPTGTNVGIGLAIPAELAKPVIDALRRGERPQRGYLGVSLQPLDEDIAGPLGLPKDRGEIVRTVQPGTPAAKAGIQQGDVILSVGGREVNPDESVSYLIANTPVGSRVPLLIVRNGRRMTIPITVEQRPSEEELARQLGQDDEQAANEEAPVGPAGQTLGLSLQPLTPQIARALNLPAGARGVVITRVDPSSDAAENLQRGDVILSVNGQAVASPAQVVAAVDAARRAGRNSVLLLVKRGTAPEAFVGVEIGG